jgi:hypothetical protein
MFTVVSGRVNNTFLYEECDIMKKWFKVVDPRDLIDIDNKLTEMYGLPWAITDNKYWYYVGGNIRNGVNYTDVFVVDCGNDNILIGLGFKIA